MFGKGSIKRLGNRLSEAFQERALHYFKIAGQPGTVPNDLETKKRFQLIGAMMAEIAEVIRITTQDEREQDE